MVNTDTPLGQKGWRGSPLEVESFGVSSILICGRKSSKIILKYRHVQKGSKRKNEAKESLVSAQEKEEQQETEQWEFIFKQLFLTPKNCNLFIKIMYLFLYA